MFWKLKYLYVQCFIYVFDDCFSLMVVCHDRDLEKLAKAGECMKRLLKLDMDEFILANLHDPIMLFYSGDGTPLTTKETWQRVWGDHKVKRKGNQANELFVQQVFAVNMDGECHVLRASRNHHRTNETIH